MSAKKGLAIPHGTHPDGDPFAAQDKLAFSNTTLGRMEAKAKEEEKRANAALAAASKPSSISSSSPSKKKDVQVVILEDTDDEEDESEAEESDVSKIKVDSGDEGVATGGDQPNDSAGSGDDDEQSESSAQATGAEDDSEESGDEDEDSEEDSDDEEDTEAEDGNVEISLVRTSTEDVVMKDEDTDQVITSPIKGTRQLNGTRQSPTKSPLAHSSSLSPANLASEPNGQPSTSRATTPPPGASGDATNEPPSPLIPKPVRRVRKPSPSPEPPKPKPPERTIRLAIVLPRKVTAVPEYSIAELAKEAGYVEEEVVVNADDKDKGSGADDGEDSTSEMDVDKKEEKKREGDEEDKMDGVVENGATVNPDGTTNPPPTQRKREPNKILGRYGGYDVEDPFVDDSDIQLYEPQYYHRPVRDGYFVCTGAVDVMGKGGRGRVQGSKNKPKYDKDGNIIPATRRKSTAGPTAANGDTSTSKVTPNGAASTSGANKGKKPEPAPIMASSIPAFGDDPVLKQKKKGEFSTEMLAEFDMLREEVKKESFEIKNKFPPRLRPILVDVALQAIALDEYDDEFFNMLPKIFPYNRFTMSKLTKREVFPKRIESLAAEHESNLQILRDGIDELLPKQRSEWEAQHKEWEIEQAGRDDAAELKRKKMEEESLRQDRELDTPEPGASEVVPAPAAEPAASGVDSKAGTPSPEDGAEEPTKGQDAPEPKWKFKFTETMRIALYRLYTIEDDIAALTIEKQNLEKATEKDGTAREKPYSVLAARKSLYSKVTALWPDDTMNNNQLSREVSLMKKKMDKDKERETAA